MTGVQTLVPIMLDHVNAGRLSLMRLVDLTSAGPARLFGIARKGRIALGYDADLTVVDRKRRETITDRWIASRAGWTPYDGVSVTGWPAAPSCAGIGSCGRASSRRRRAARRWNSSRPWRPAEPRPGSGEPESRRGAAAVVFLIHKPNGVTALAKSKILGSYRPWAERSGCHAVGARYQPISLRLETDGGTRSAGRGAFRA
jgi:hypothetical protein